MELPGTAIIKWYQNWIFVTVLPDVKALPGNFLITICVHGIARNHLHFLKNVKIIKFLWWKWQESLSLWKQILAIPSSLYATMKSPGITLSFHKIFFWNNASYSWQFLDHYMWIRNCQDCMYNPKVSAPTHLKPLRQALYFLTLPWVIRGKTQLG